MRVTQPNPSTASTADGIIIIVQGTGTWRSMQPSRDARTHGAAIKKKNSHAGSVGMLVHSTVRTSCVVDQTDDHCVQGDVTVREGRTDG